MQGFLQTLIPLSPFLSPCCKRTHSEGIHAALPSSELLPAMVYQCVLPGRSWCPFSSDPQSPQKETLLLSLCSVHYKHTKNTSSHAPQQQAPASSVTALQASLLLLSTISPVLLPLSHQCKEDEHISTNVFPTRKQQYNSPWSSCLTFPKQGSSQPKKHVWVCFCSSILKKISAGFNAQPLNSIHMALQWDRSGCGSASMSNCCSPFCQPGTGWAKQWPAADMALTTEAHHKGEVNNYPFQICSMHEGNMAGNSTLLIENELSFEQWVQNHSPASVLKCSWRGFNMHQVTNDTCGIGMISAMWKQP